MKFFKLLKWVFGILFGIAFFWLVVMKIISRLASRFGVSGPCPVFLSGILDNQARLRMANKILKNVDIQPGETVLELGPGPGAFTVAAAQQAGLQGKLIAVDIQPGMIAKVEKKVAQAGLLNVETHVASAYELPLTDASVDRAFLVTVLMEIPDPNRALAELYRVLKPGGVLSITEQFPDPDYPFAFETVERVETAGFKMMGKSGNVWAYTVNFVKTSLLPPEVLDVVVCPACHNQLTMCEEPPQLHCPSCQVDYPVHGGIPYFIQPAELTGLNRRFAKLYDWFSWVYRPFSKVAFAVIGMTEAEGRGEVLNRLEPHGGRVLEVSIGPGVNLPYLVDRQDVGQVYGLDISAGQIKSCRSYVRQKGWEVELFLGNAEELPFQDNSFEAVFHIGGINFFNDKKKAIEEMIRVAKPGTRILIADESEKGARGYELTIPGFKRSFENQREVITPPVDLVPKDMEELRLFDIWKGWLYCIEFRKPIDK